MKNCVTLELKCAVQTGGIRPFFWKLTAEAGLTGWITKSNGGVILRLEGDDGQISSFIRDLPVRVPSAFRLRTVCVLRRENQVPDDQCQLSFRMLDPIGEIPEIPPDRAPCEHCAAETMELSSRRYCYPFFSCRDCGPGYSLALRSPFIRRNTTLTAFPLWVGREHQRPGGDTSIAGHQPGDTSFARQPYAMARLPASPAISPVKVVTL